MQGQHLQKRLAPLLTETRARISEAGFKIDYLEVKTAQLDSIETDAASAIFNGNQQDLVILVAAWLGRARLLDNQLVTVTLPS